MKFVFENTNDGDSESTSLCEHILDAFRSLNR